MPSIRAFVRLGLGWRGLEATVVDVMVHKKVHYQSESGGGTYKLLDVMVDFTARNGAPKRLIIREKDIWVKLPEKGGTVPILVNRRETKAMFNLLDRRVDAHGRQRDHAKQERAAEKKHREKREAEFRSKLEE